MSIIDSLLNESFVKDSFDNLIEKYKNNSTISTKYNSSNNLILKKNLNSKNSENNLLERKRKSANFEEKINNKKNSSFLIMKFTFHGMK